MELNTYRVAIIGAGNIAGSHLEAMRAMSSPDRLTPCAIADVNSARADALAGKYGIRSYIDYKEMLAKEKPDIAIVTLPHYLHREASLFAAEQGCHILLEKPMALNTKECDEIIAAVRRNRVRMMVGHTHHYTAENREAKSWIASGRLGKLVMMNDRRHLPYDTPARPGWFFEKAKAGGGILTNLGSHSIDKLQWLTDSRVTGIKARVDYSLRRGDVEGGGTAFLDLSSGVPATISQSGYPGAIVDETELLFTGGSLLLRSGIGLWAGDGREYREVPVPPQAPPFVLQFEDLLGAIEEGREPESSMAYSRSVVAAVESLYRSSELGTEVAVDQGGGANERG
ncbi:Gfo/Idh/MocA family oxidoreductase [Cohnella fermenti]|uniref:Gfo/Idh/MocA family oxidoreductase n=2 Tax=Cohnella fermenti TaxID=2565925 RepID=A0A4S4C857_9BACL|nr:Gfo/Idh/MocA family oxidoreductase [Cohnella fermenti]